jgi:hypothetical protein
VAGSSELHDQLAEVLTAGVHRMWTGIDSRIPTSRSYFYANGPSGMIQVVLTIHHGHT